MRAVAQLNIRVVEADDIRIQALRARLLRFQEPARRCRAGPSSRTRRRPAPPITFRLRFGDSLAVESRRDAAIAIISVLHLDSGHFLIVAAIHSVPDDMCSQSGGNCGAISFQS